LDNNNLKKKLFCEVEAVSIACSMKWLEEEEEENEMEEEGKRKSRRRRMCRRRRGMDRRLSQRKRKFFLSFHLHCY